MVCGSVASPRPQLTIKRNIITGSGGPGIDVQTGAGFLITQNSTYGNGVGGTTGVALVAGELRRPVGLQRLLHVAAALRAGLTVEEIYAVGKRYLRESKKALARAANEIKPGASVEEAKEIVKSDHPARFEEARPLAGHWTEL